MLKNTFNGRYIVRNLMIATILMAVVASVMTVVMFGGKGSAGTPEEVVMAAESRQVIYISEITNLNPVSIPVIMTDMDAGTVPEVEPNDTEMVAEVEEPEEVEETTEAPVEEEVTTEEVDNSNTKPEPKPEPVSPEVDNATTEAPVEEETTTEAPEVEEPETEETTEETTEEETTEETTEEAPSDNFITVQPTNRGPIVLTQEEINLMACIVTLESGSESYEGQLAVANVILNRLENGYWGDTVTEVIYAPYQFSTASSPYLDYYLTNGAYSTSIQAVMDALAGNNNIGTFMYFRALYIVDDPNSFGTHTIIGNHLFY